MIARETSSQWLQTYLPIDAGRTRLEIWHRADDFNWVSVTAEYWSGALSGLSLIPSSASTKVERGSPAGAGNECCFKRFFPRNTFDRLKHLVRASRAMRAFRGCELLRRQGFNVPSVRCMIQARVRGIIQESALITDNLQFPTVVEWLRVPVQTLSAKRSFLRVLGIHLGRMHRAGIALGDANPGNILVHAKDNGFRFYLLDNERVAHYRRLPQRVRLRNLKELNKMGPPICNADRLRLWKAYQSVAKVKGEKEVIRELVRLTRQSWERHGVI